MPGALTPGSGTKSLPPAAMRLMGARVARSLAQGALVVDFALYVKQIGWSAGLLGGVLAAGMMFNALLTLLVGPLSDRLGRKGFVVSYEGLVLAASAIAIWTTATVPLAIASVIGGFGRGSNGSAGPFAPAEQSWLSGLIERRRLGSILSLNLALGVFGMAAGALLAAAVGPRRALFGLPVAMSFIAATLVLLTADPPHPPKPAAAAREGQAREAERGLLWRLAGLNILNGTGIGLTGPFMSWWFAARFHVHAAAIGPALAAGFVISGFAALGAGGLTRRLGVIRTVVVMRGFGLLLLTALPFSPSFAVAAAIYALRSAFNRGTAGARQALALGLVRDHRRGLAASVNAFSIQVPRGIAPAASGVLFEMGALAVPFLLAAAFQAAYLVLYPCVFAGHDPSRQ